MKGYSGMYVVKAVTDKIGKVDSKAFSQAMKGARISAKEYPGVLLDVTFDQNGDLDRESFLVKVVNGKQEWSARRCLRSRASNVLPLRARSR